MAEETKDITILFRGLSPKSRSTILQYTHLMAQAEKNAKEENKEKESQK